MSGADAIQAEFTRAAAFDARTRGRYDGLDVVGFSRVAPHESVVEIGAGTGNFLSLFVGSARMLVAVEFTHAMRRHVGSCGGAMHCVVGDGARLPLRRGSIDLVACALMLHHIERPVRVIAGMARTCAPEGRVLIVDQAAPGRFEHAAAMYELETMRDPTHAASRPPQAFGIICSAAGLQISDQKIVESRMRLSQWMSPDEFPKERMDAVREFIEVRGNETGMDWQRDGDDWQFNRRRIMILATRNGEM